MDYMIGLGFICQKAKTSLPAQTQKICGMLFDTTGIPTIRIPEEKLSWSKAMLEFVLALNEEAKVLQLTCAVMAGMLQSLVVATPLRQGQTYLRPVYNDTNMVDELNPRLKYYTKVLLSEQTLADLQWLKVFLQRNPGNRSPTSSLGSLTVTVRRKPHSLTEAVRAGLYHQMSWHMNYFNPTFQPDFQFLQVSNQFVELGTG
jgi:hypothetical protein